MKRTQLCLEQAMWTALSVRARRQGTTVSELVRDAACEKLGSRSPDREAAMKALVGMWADREDIPPADVYVRPLRRTRRPAGDS